MIKLKKGDRVRCLVSHEGQFTKGKIYTVTSASGGAVNILADDVGDNNGWVSKYFKFVRHASKPTPIKTKPETFQCSFKELYIEPPQFAKLLADEGLTFTNRKKINNAFVFGFKGGHIVLTNDPLTGASSKGYLSDIGFAEDVGIEGTKAFRNRVAAFLRANATYGEYNAQQRRYV